MLGTRRGPLALLHALSLGLALAGCAESDLAGHLAASLDGDSSPGQYKVGDPYQINGIWYTPQEDFYYDETGIASWYGPGFHGNLTANGERFDEDALTAAHPTLQMPTLVRVTNLDNGRSLVLRINDRGPFAHSRIIDVSKRAAELLGFRQAGTAQVRVQVLSEESRQLAEASGRHFAEGSPLPGSQSRQVAAVPPQRVLADRPAAFVPASVQQAAPAVRQPAPVAPPSSALFVQAGAFTSYANAQQFASSLSRLGQAQVTQAPVGGVTFYRVRLGPYADPSEASRALSEVLAAGHDDARLVSN